MRVAEVRRPPSGRDFVGREAELDLAGECLADLQQGRGRVVMLSGEAGIGKTRFLEELLSRCRKSGAVVLSGSCADGGVGGGYGPFREALDRYVAELGEETLRDQLGAHAGAVAQLVPRVRARLTDLPELQPLRPEDERARLMNAVSQFVMAIAARAPLVLALDDVHWADHDTLALLRHVARAVEHHRLLLVATYRHGEVGEDDGALAEALAVLRRLPGTKRIVLNGLALPEVEDLLEKLAERGTRAWAVGGIEDELVKAIHFETRGNPFFVRSLVEHLVDEGRLRLEEGRWSGAIATDGRTLPHDVRQLLSRRIGRLSQTAQTFLAIASAVGAEFAFEVVVRVGELDEEQALAAVDEILQAQLIEPAERLDWYGFSHALVRRTLYDSVAELRRMQLHRRIAEEMQRGSREAGDAGEIARHFHLSSALPGADQGVSPALAAAERAEDCVAFAEAAVYLQMALDLLPSDDSRRAHLLSRRARNLAYAQQADDALAAIGEAGALIARQESAGAAAAFFAEMLDPLFAAGFFRHAFEVARLGLPHAEGRRDWVWAALAAIGAIEGEFSDPAHPGIAVESPEREEIGARLAERAPAVPSYAWMFIRRDLLAKGADTGADVYWRGEYRRSLPRLYAWAKKFPDQLFAGADSVTAWAAIARCHTALGEFDRARAALQRCTRILDSAPSAVGRWIFEAAVDELRAALDRGWSRVVGMTRPPTVPWYRASQEAVFARIHARLGSVEPALRCLEALVPAVERSSGRSDSYVMIADRAVETLWLTQSTVAIEALESNVRAKILAPDFRYPMTDSRLSLARLCALQGRHEEARDFFALARRVLDEQGARPLRAIVDFDEALQHLRRGSRGDRERAEPLLDLALAQFRTLGMSGWIRRAEALSKGAGMPTAEESSRRQPALFRPEGESWAVAYDGRSVQLKNARGMAFLAYLLSHPGHRIAACELVRCGDRRGPLEPATEEGAMQAERARINATRAITAALEKIASVHAPLAEHLRRTIRTGTFCSYAPDPRAPIEWET